MRAGKLVGATHDMAGDEAQRQRSRWLRSLLHLNTDAARSGEDEEGRLEYELTMLQETARVLSSTFDLESVFAALVRTAALIVSAPHERQRRASLLRLEGDTLVSVAEYDEENAGFAGSRYDLERFPGMRSIAEARKLVTMRMADLDIPEPIRSRVLDTGLVAAALAPLVVGGEVFGVLTVSSRDPKGFSESQLRRLEAVVHIGELAVANARSYAVLVANAATDSLTGLKNRREFERALGHQPRERYAVLAIDVDNLKPINDAHGHEAGDAVLRSTAAVLSAQVRTGDVLARVGGDEFAVLLLGASGDEAEKVAERMRKAVHEIELPNGQARISVGCAGGATGDDPHVTWRNADMAMYAAKRQGRDRVHTDTSPAAPSEDPSAS
jgi:diguanylate cyclase (GGDEF)-like protein